LLDETGFQNRNICEVLALSISSTAAIRGIQMGKDVMFEIKLKKSHEAALLVI
jgi:hypothetical protein